MEKPPGAEVGVRVGIQLLLKLERKDYDTEQRQKKRVKKQKKELKGEKSSSKRKSHSGEKKRPSRPITTVSESSSSSKDIDPVQVEERKWKRSGAGKKDHRGSDGVIDTNVGLPKGKPSAVTSAATRRKRTMRTKSHKTAKCCMYVGMLSHSGDPPKKQVLDNMQRK